MRTTTELNWWLIGVVGVVLAGLLGGGCKEPTAQSPGVTSHLEGHVTVRPPTDTADNHEGFRVLVADADGRAVDTLAHAVTGPDGHFRAKVVAPARDVYSLTIWGRQGQRRIATTELVVAASDTARLNAALPLQLRQLRVRSVENDAWAGYQNILAQHRRLLLRGLKDSPHDLTATSQGIRQTSSMLWGLRDTYPGTYAAQAAAVESLSLLERWHDSLVVVRVDSIRSTNPRYVEAAQIARRAAARWGGQTAALRLLDSLRARASTPAQRAGVEAIRVRAFMDSLRRKKALKAAENLRIKYPDTEWARWADRARYEVERLLPGMQAPAFAARTLQGDSVSLQAFRGQALVLEFYRPRAGRYAQQVATRNVLHRATRSDSVTFIAVSLEPDTLVNRAFLSGRSLSGYQVIAPRGGDDPVVEAYNVVRTPARFLLDAQGRIVGRYEGADLLALQNDLMGLIATDSSRAPVS